MPNTGRFYAPPAAATAYRERFMRPYSTVSPPMGTTSHHLSMSAAPAAKSAMPQASYSRASTSSMRRPAPSDSEPYSPPYGTSYESRVRSRPSAGYEEERRWRDAYAEKQFPRPGAWSEEEENDEVSVRRGAPLAPVGATRFVEMTPQQHIAAAATYEPRVATTSRGAFETTPLPSTLPRLSSLLKRTSAEVENYESEDRFMTRKRARELSPEKSEVGFAHAKTNRRFYEEDVYAERRTLSQYNEPTWAKDRRAQEPRVTRQEMPMAMKNPSVYANAPHQSGARHNQTSPTAPTRQFGEQARYTYASDERDEQMRRSHVMHREQLVERSEFEEAERAFDMQRRNYYSPNNQRTQPNPSALSSPPPTLVARDRFSPVGRYSDSKEGDCVIEAAADLVEERSPSKRESITKLLLKSKEFLKAKSLVRNRNNEIDWVATFLNVGFESNSIYSLMCPLRKGRWKVEEEKYTMELLRLIESGVIRLRHGQSIRGFIAKKLHSDDMRVLKKLSNCKMFHFARLINPRMSDEEEVDESIPNVRSNLDRLEKLKAEFLRSVQLEALVAVRKYLSDTSIRDLLNARD